MKDFLAMLVAAIRNFDHVAQKQLNDLLEENELERIDFPKLVYMNDNKITTFLPIKEVDQEYEELTDDLVGEFFGVNACNNEFDEYAEKCEKYYMFVEEYNIPYKKIESPKEWGFNKEDLEKSNRLRFFFKKFCTLPERKWW